jgi:2-amino-4-hydroxy-6-hydroxymethyldihydropteridine diphosphokinase
MVVAYIALGSNLGDRAATLDAAVRRLRAEPGLRVLAVSNNYETDPVGGPAGQGKFLNAAAAVETDRSPEDLLALLHRIEHQFGRTRGAKDGPRTLDLDLLLYGDRVIDTPTLTVPHPRMHQRAFVLMPLSEIAAVAVHPTIGKDVLELLAEMPREEWPAVRTWQSRSVSTGELAGLTALVTGSTSGIGLAIADAFRARGAEVITHGRRPDTFPYVTADLRDPDQCDRLLAGVWADRLDVLVLNAGADTLTGEAGKWSFERKLDELIAVDLKSTIHLARAFGAKMKARGRGVILTVGWDQAETGMDGDSGQLFGAVKGAVMCFTRSLALSLAPQVRVNCLAPGWVRTAWGETASADWQERVRRETPLGVWGLPEDVAAAACWLASPAAAFVTGQTLRVNGGAVR